MIVTRDRLNWIFRRFWLEEIFPLQERIKELEKAKKEVKKNNGRKRNSA